MAPGAPHSPSGPADPGPAGGSGEPPESLFERIFRISPAPMTISDLATGRILLVNDAWVHLIGFSREQMIGRTSVELGLLSLEDRAPAVAKVRAQGSVRAVPLQIRTRGGLIRTCLVSSEVLSDPAGPRLLSTCQDITVQRAQAERLERFAEIFQASPEAIAIARVDDGTYFEVNQRFLDMIGLPKDQVIGRTSTELNVWVQPGDRERYLAELVKHGCLHDFEMPFRMAGNQILDLEVSSEIIEFRGRPHTFNFLRDITARKRAAQALLDSEAQFRLLFDTAPVGLAVVESESGRYLSANPRMGEILGYPPGELLGRSFKEFTHPDHLSANVALVHALAAGELLEARTEKRYLSRTGAVIWARLTMVRIPAPPGTPARHLALVQDISAEHEAQLALESALGRLQKIADRVPGMVYQYRWSADGCASMVFASKGLRELYELEPEQVYADIGLMRQRHHPDDDRAMQESIRASAETLSPWQFEFRVLLPERGARTLFGDAVPEREPDGATLWTGFLTDITERKLLEAQLQQAQKMDSLGSLASGVAHDMNNVLGAILALASVHLLDLPEDDPAYQALDTIREAAIRGGNMVKSLLNFARQSPKERRLVDFNELLLEEARLLEHTTLAKVRLELDLAPDLRGIFGDPGELAHAIMNLCINAVDAMEAGGSLLLRTGNHGDAQIRITVQDSGCGMAKTVLEKAMDPFYTTKEVGKGTGLGLALVYATVKAHQGSLEIQSEPGVGTQVHLDFPAVLTQDLSPESRPQPRLESHPGSLEILLVDDDDLVLRSTKMLVEVLGHRVTACTCGEAALAEVDQGLRPEVIILDMNMPGLGGKGTLGPLRSRCPAVPILLATGRADQDALDLIATQPEVYLLSKPFSLDDLQEHLRRFAARG